MEYGQSYGGEGDKEETKKQRGRFLSFKERTERNWTGQEIKWPMEAHGRREKHKE